MPSTWRRRLLNHTLLALGALACSNEDITAPSCDRCDELLILSDRPEYRPGAVVRITITNLTREALTYDWCSIALASRSTDVAFESVYRPSRRCGPDAGLQQVLAHLQTIAPGETQRDSLIVTVSYQGQQRVHVWLVDDNGIPEAGNPVASNVFFVYPGASQSIGLHDIPEQRPDQAVHNGRTMTAGVRRT